MPGPVRSVALVTLGCARNEVDSEELAGRLDAEGWQLTSILNLQTGMPYTLGDFGNDISYTGELNDRWNMTGNPKDIHWSPSHPLPYFDFSDAAHSNAYAAWQRMGSPQSPTAAQQAELVRAGKLERVVAARATMVKDGAVAMPVVLARQGVALVRLTW